MDNLCLWFSAPKSISFLSIIHVYSCGMREKAKVSKEKENCVLSRRGG